MCHYEFICEHNFKNEINIITLINMIRNLETQFLVEIYTIIDNKQHQVYHYKHFEGLNNIWK